MSIPLTQTAIVSHLYPRPLNLGPPSPDAFPPSQVFEKTNGPLTVRHDHPVVQQKDLKPGEALVRIKYTGVCVRAISPVVPNPRGLFM